MRTVVVLSVLWVLSSAHAHDGHDHNSPPPASIQNGKLKSLDNLTYFDAGTEVEWLDQKLKRKITDKNQIVYQYSGDFKETTTEQVADESKFLNLKVEGSEAFKAFSFNHAGELKDSIELLSPDFSNEVIVQKNKDFRLQWKADTSASMVKVIFETYSATGQLTGRLTVSTNDDGDFNVPAQYLNQLPNDNGKIAVKRIWLGEFKINQNDSEKVGVRSVASAVAKVKMID
ncbi:MAG: hypothetical protein ABL930_09820 [Pseudobdellovibrio sp.]